MNTLNKIFFVSSSLLSLTFFLMFVQDYERPWKKYQRTFVKMEKEKTLGPLLKGPPEEALKKLNRSLSGE